jgi:hypothetical protein
MAVKNRLRVASDLYKGAPEAFVDVDLDEGEHFDVELKMSDTMARKVADRVSSGKVSISLEALDVEFRPNQSFGMVAASTGCISNPGGPSC